MFLKPWNRSIRNESHANLSQGKAPSNIRVLAYKPFALFASARILSTISFQIVAVAVGWEMYALTSSALFLGLVGLAQFIPMIILTLPAGHSIDRYDRRRIVIACQILEMLVTASLAVLCGFRLLDQGILLCLVFLVGAARSFEAPGQQALLPTILPKEIFPSAIAWNASATQVAFVVGPALGGLLYTINPTAAFAGAAFLYLLSAILVGQIHSSQPAPKREPASFATVFAGIDFIRSRPIILGAISLDLFAVLLGGATALLPIYAKDILFTSSLGLGVLRSSPAIGALVMSIFLAQKPVRHRVGAKMFTAVSVFGLATIGFALSRSFILSMLALVVLGAADVVSVVIRQSLVQLKTPDEMRGRVSAVNSIFIGTSNQLGEFESGLTAAWFGTVPAVLIGGLGTLAVVALWIKLFPDLAKADS